MGRFSEGHPTFRTVDLTEVRDPIPRELIADVIVLEIELGTRRKGDFYIDGFAAGHKPDCSLAFTADSM